MEFSLSEAARAARSLAHVESTFVIAPEAVTGRAGIAGLVLATCSCVGMLPGVNGGNRRGPRGSLARRRRLSAGIAFSCALLGFAACSTYDDSLLTSSQGAADSGGSAGVGAGGAAPSGAAPSGGAGTQAGSVGSGGSSPVGTAGHPASDAGAAGTPEGGADGGSSGSASVAGGSAGRSSAGGATGNTGGATASMGGTGTSGGAGGSATSGGVGGTGTTGGSPSIDMIDDFEADDTLHMQVILNNGRNGYWYPIKDATVGGVQTLAIGALTGSNVRAGSSFAMHMTASGFTDFGAGFGADFVNVAAAKAPYDVSAYKGIRFYAKVAASTLTSLKLLIPTTYSDVMGGKCSDTVPMMHCSDHLFCQVNGLKTTWDVYECDFANLKQVGYGLKQTSLDPKSVYSVQFSFLAATTPADIWVDDVAFVLK